jgi:N-acetylmuramoyl-L-alanine amidase
MLIARLIFSAIFLLTSAAFAAEKNAVPAKPKPVLTAKAQKLHDIIVILDPGHGGKDPGAHGRLGTLEKNVVIAISRYVQTELKKTKGIKVYLTRSRDVYIPLRDRLSIARKYKADIFIAIHADAFQNTAARGASIFALSQRGATSESARWLAEQENQSELGGANLNDKDYVLKSVLLDMSQTNTINASLNLGQSILAYLNRFTQLHSRKVEQAAFVVLKSPDIPSLLIETGFISNPQEERNLRSPAYQQKLAQKIAAGIIDYFKENTPPNTTFGKS